MLNLFFFKKNSLVCKTSKIYPFSRITNSTIGSYSYISYSSQINNAEIGKYCSISKRVSVGLGFHPTNFISTSPMFYSPKNPLLKSFVKESKFEDFKPISIGNDVWIGTNVVVLDGVTIGDGVIIAANSVVNKNVEPYSIVGGVPARFIRHRFEPKTIEKLLKIKWWNLPDYFLKQKKIINIFSKELDFEMVQTLEKIVIDFENKLKF